MRAIDAFLSLSLSLSRRLRVSRESRVLLERQVEITTLPTGFPVSRAVSQRESRKHPYLASRSLDKSRTLSSLVSDGDGPSL